MNILDEVFDGIFENDPTCEKFLHMENEGIVSVWAGVFEDDDALWDYADEVAYDSDSETLAPFNHDFFESCKEYIFWPFDTDFWERACVDPTTDPEKLVERFSEGTVIGPALKKIFPNGFEKPYNAAILIYNYQYDLDKVTYNPNAPVTFLAAVPYEDEA